VEELRAAWGIADGYHDVGGRWVAAEPEAVERALAAMGADGAPPPAPIVFARRGEPAEVGEPSELVTEDGAVLGPEAWPSTDLPLGYHTLRRLRDGAETRLVVSPRACHLPEDLQAWGWAVQLYAVRSRASWGMGDLADLRELARWSRRELGAGLLVVNPLHAPLPLLPQEPSPYYPSSRRFRNPLYLRVEEVPGAERLGERLAPLARAARALDGERLLQRDRVFELKMQAVEELFEAADPADSEFEAYRRREAPDLRDYATFCALSEHLGCPWQGWPAELRRPDSAAVEAFRAEHLRRVRFHEWLQWLLDRQLAAATAEIGLVQDLAIGVRGDGADAWMWQDVLPDGVTVGAPPDPFNTDGQDWGLPPFDPWRLRAAAYEPFVRTVRAAFRHGAGLRVDHVMGLFRLYWIPAGLGPAHGVYVRYPHRELLDLLALESHRGRAFVVGEDLGTVEEEVREELSRRRVLSTRLLWFEERPPGDYPRDSLAALTTHDLPTLAGVWEGSDSDDGLRERLRRQAGLEGGESAEEAAECAHRALAASPSRLLSATLEDALGVSERPNKPGTLTEWPNWSLALPATLEELERSPGAARLARTLARQAGAGEA
jgi:4-alpha-glucanotransferase